MSFARNSSPDSPSGQMPVTDDNVAPNTPVPDGKANVNGSSSENFQPTGNVNESEDVVMAPSNNPMKSTNSQETGEKEQEETNQEIASDSDSSPFDWQNLHSRYTEALKAASAKEDALVDEFEQYSEAFLSWANSSSDRENERAQKRLKTRETYVQMSERELENKKTHYSNVVEAFRGALRLLQSQSPRPSQHP